MRIFYRDENNIVRYKYYELEFNKVTLLFNLSRETTVYYRSYRDALMYINNI